MKRKKMKNKIVLKNVTKNELINLKKVISMKSEMTCKEILVEFANVNTEQIGNIKNIG